MQLTTKILKFMRTADYQPMKPEQIRVSLGLPSKRESEVRKALSVLKNEGKVIETKKGRFALPAQLNLLVGELAMSKAGYGFVKTSVGDLFVPGSKLRGAMHGDRVAIRILKSKRREGVGTEGEVISVVERAVSRLVGRFEKHGRMNLVVPADRRYIYPIIVAKKASGGARDGDMVVVQITIYPDRYQPARGRVIEVLGDESLPTIEIDVIVREHNLATAFPAGVLAEAERLPDTVSASEIRKRCDYRDIFTVTIDGLEAKDFDDAVSVSKDETGHYRLIVHIADVSYYVPVGSEIDKEAFRRATSVYLADRVLPMLPPKLSEEICSLKKDQDRLTLSVEMIVDQTGKVRKFGIKEGVIRSKARLTYREVDKMFKSGCYPSKEVKKLLLTLQELSDVLEAKRIQRGSLNFETIEPKVVLDENLKPVDIILRERTPATKLIEETMILTNEVIADFMFWQEAPMIYRIHERPGEEGLFQLAELLSALGYPVKRLNTAHPRALQQVIEYASDRPERLLINTLLLRAMKKARYSPACVAHYGLASERYTHFTSPIRRYPDLVVHRLVKATLNGNLLDPEVISLTSRLEEICRHSSLQEQEADEAERESVEVKICELMKEFIGESFEAMVTGVAGYGIFVQLPNSAEGLVHVRDLKDDFYNFEEELFLLRGRRTGRVFRIGEKVRVKLTNVVVGERRLDFVLSD
jgi:ribonuclease R